jgi:hypothetical protein
MAEQLAKTRNVQFVIGSGVYCVSSCPRADFNALKLINISRNLVGVTEYV